MLLGVYGRTKRNALRLGNCPIPYSKIFADTNERLPDYQAAQVIKLPDALNLGPTHWSLPPTPFLKANFNGALSKIFPLLV